MLLAILKHYMTFKNSRYFTKQEFEIKKTSLKISRKTFFDEVEFSIIHAKKFYRVYRFQVDNCFCQIMWF